MAQVTVTINGHLYPVACDPGEEHRIRDLARVIDGKVAGFARQFARAGEARLIMLAALMLADELGEANETLRRLTARAAAKDDDPVLADGIERLARRVETVAARLENAHIS
jgi:cell division protein ZapA